MSGPNPIVFNEVANLATLGVASESIKFGDLTFESDAYVCVREKVGDKMNLTMVELANGNQVVRRPIQAEAAIMNPRGGVIALRAGATIQIFDINEKKKLKSFKLEDDLSGGFYWRWATPDMVAMVTPTSVYHWSLQGSSDPEKIFDKHALMQPTQIINYRVSPDGKWCLLVGILAGQVQGTIDGHMQLYSIEKRVSQPLQGHAGCFTTIHAQGAERQVLAFVEKKPALGPKLFVMEIGKDKDAPGGVFKITPADVPFTPEASADFPVALIPSKKHEFLYLVTKMGFLFLFDTHTGETVYRTRVSQETVFASVPTENDSAMLGVTARKGQLLKIGVNDHVLVPYLLSLQKSSTAMRLATKLGLSGADNLYTQEFERLFQAGDYKGAAKVAAESPRGMLRTAETIARFQRLATTPGQPAPALQYFQTLLEKGKLNAVESVELARPVVQQNRLPMLEQWLKDDKLECSEQLGDLIVGVDAKMAMAVYGRGNAPDKVINCFIHMGDFNSVVAFAKKSGHHPDYVILLQNLVRQDPKKAEAFAKLLVTPEPGQAPLINLNTVTDVFMQLNRIQETTQILLEALKPDRPEDGPLQTRLLEINLLGGAPQVADAIFAAGMFHHYDRAKVARLCEKAGLFQRALEHTTDPNDIKRIVLYTQAINPEYLVNFFANVPPGDTMECLHSLLQHNLAQNLQIVVQIASKYYETLGSDAVIQMFDKYRSAEGTYFFCGSILSVSPDPLVHFKYLQAATTLGHMEQVIKFCREDTAYDPTQVKEFLLAERLQDPRPLIHVCDRHGFIDELTTYLFTQKLLPHIQVYVEKVSPQNAPQVVGRLLDLDAEEAFLVQLLSVVRRECPVERLVEEVEKRNRLRLLRSWLEQRVAEGNTEPATHNALAKIYIQTNSEPETFLVNNQFYDSKVVGQFCRKLDPHLAFVAYKRAWGACDAELMELCVENELFKDLSRYLVQRQDAELWAQALDASNPHRRRVVDETVQTALPECREPEKISVAVRAFMTADMPHELILLLDRLVLQGTPGDGFSENPSLQNLLVLTAVKTEPTKVMDLVHRLDHFDASTMADICCQPEHGLFEEAFEILQKFKLHVEAVDVLLVHLNSLDRAVAFAQKCEAPKVWSRLARAQLDANLVEAAIDSYVTAEDPEQFVAVIAAAERAEKNEALIKYLRMARKRVKEQKLDSALVYSLAKIDKLQDLEEFVASPNVANVQDVGDRCYAEGMFEAAVVLFESISNNAQLALAYVKLNKFKEAVDCAKKASSIKTWKQLNHSCVEAQEWRLAEVAGLHILKSPDHIDDLVAFYESRGHFDHLVQLFEKGLALEGANKAVFTGLAVLYAKHHPDKLLEHIRAYGPRMIMAKVMHACEEARLWREASLLFVEAGEHDNAVRCMIDHPETAWEHDKFLISLASARNPELLYKAVSFYVEYAPQSLGGLLTHVTPKLDHARCVALLRKLQQVPLALPYLKAVQSNNLAAVNEALNEVYVQEGDDSSLQASIDEFSNFDHVKLAQLLEKHEFLPFRRVAASLYAKQNKFAEAIKLLKQDGMYKEAMATAQQSNSPEIALGLLEYFVKEVKDKDCFAACLFACYDLLPGDVVLELAWRHQLTDQAMPYMIQWMKSTNAKLKELEERVKPAAKQQASEASQPGGFGNTLMLGNAPYGQQPGYYGQPPGY